MLGVLGLGLQSLAVLGCWGSGFRGFWGARGFGVLGLWGLGVLGFRGFEVVCLVFWGLAFRPTVLRHSRENAHADIHADPICFRRASMGHSSQRPLRPHSSTRASIGKP